MVLFSQSVPQAVESFRLVLQPSMAGLELTRSGCTLTCSNSPAFTLPVLERQALSSLAGLKKIASSFCHLIAQRQTGPLCSCESSENSFLYRVRGNPKSQGSWPELVVLAWAQTPECFSAQGVTGDIGDNDKACSE